MEQHVCSCSERQLTDKQGGAYLPCYINIEVCYIYKTRNELVRDVLKLSFSVYNSLIRLIGHFRALYPMYLSLGVGIGRGGSPNHQQI